MKKKKHKKSLKISAAIAVFFGLCCFTPLLVLAFGVLGFSAYLGYLDYVLLPLLGISIVLTIFFYLKYRSCEDDCKLK